MNLNSPLNALDTRYCARKTHLGAQASLPAIQDAFSVDNQSKGDYNTKYRGLWRGWHLFSVTVCGLYKLFLCTERIEQC